MTAFIQWITKIFGAWKPWLIVKPWEIGIRVRLGKRATALQPGPHLRLPLLDHVQTVNTRLRIVTTPTVTLSNGKPGYARVRSLVLGFRIADPLKAMMAYTDPEGVAMAKAQAALSISETVEDCQRELEKLDGILMEFVRFTDDVEVRTYRLLQQQWGVHGFQDKENY